ncbi:hypothetical protein GCM10010280_49410 [Streptomyces pilosus]|uniref:Uncharacterized protein n=1 Tax=Streptomyces pilosus TaxID=28893 RepID=A0A918BWP7_9ACTN|nr:hypothetical protein GCM10010280_49410 [Streptomyces pilosus]
MQQPQRVEVVEVDGHGGQPAVRQGGGERGFGGHGWGSWDVRDECRLHRTTARPHPKQTLSGRRERPEGPGHLYEALLISPHNGPDTLA